MSNKDKKLYNGVSWQQYFLDVGKFYGCGDLSIMISTLSMLITAAEKRAYKQGVQDTIDSHPEFFNSSEIVICAAVRAKDGYVVRGHRHHLALRAMQSIPRYIDERPYGDDQGFVTSRNRYVTRKEGYELQIAAGIESVDKENPYAGGELYSEDLY